GGAVLYLAGGAAAKGTLQVGTLVWAKETAYHNIRVVDSGLRRFLYFNNLTQGFVPVRADVEVPPNYTDGLSLAWAFRREPGGSAVLIGLGAGMIPSLLSS